MGWMCRGTDPDGGHGGEAGARDVDEAARESPLFVALVAVHGDAVQVAGLAHLGCHVQVFAHHDLAEYLRSTGQHPMV